MVEATEASLGSRFISSAQSLVNRGLQDDGSLIILIDIIVLTVLLSGALFFSVFEIYRKRRRRKERRKKNILPLHNLETSIENNTESLIITGGGSDMEEDGPEDATENRDISSQSRHSGSTEILIPLPPSSSPTLPTYPSTLALKKRLTPTTPPPDPDSYGDPYPSPLGSSSRRPSLRKSHTRSSLFSGSRHSIASMISSKFGRTTYGRFSRLSESSYPDDPALSDTRSNVLARELSRSTHRTFRDRGNSISSSMSFDRVSRTDDLQAASITMPPLVFKHGDLQIY